MRRLTNEEFIEKASNIHKEFYNYSKVEYTGNRNKITIICPLHGEFEQMAQSHLKGCGCKVCRSENMSLTTEEFIEKAIKIHGTEFCYEDANYINSQTEIVIGCKVHGKFLQRPNRHLAGGGCPKCGNILKSNPKSLEKYIEEVTVKHNGFYSYEKVVYVEGKNKIIIVCPIHGEFLQRADTHLQGCGCSKCNMESHWTRSKYIKKAKGRICTFYTLRCFNENEEFYKIGITMNTIKERYPSTERMPYSYKIISEIHGEAGFIWDLEREEKIKLKDFSYHPLIKFNGSKTECFTQY